MKSKNMLYPLILTGLVIFLVESCKKDGTAEGPIYGENVTDVDGNVYHTVIIDKQTWMVENLKVIHYKDGKTLIPNVTDSLKWKSLTDAACCIYNNDNANFKTYGVLYNWYAASNSALCPKGWHVASNSEWLELHDWVNGQTSGANKLKEAGTTHWNSPNSGANNSTGFTALPAGARYANGNFYDIGNVGYVWSSTAWSLDEAWGGWLATDKSEVGVFHVYKKLGFSVRCVKDIVAAPAVPQ